MAKTPVLIVTYDTRWPRWYEEERARILARIGPHVHRIEHVGSTSVPGLAAKPIIDIMAGLRRLSDAGECIEPLAAIDYEYVPEYEVSLPERRYFRKGPPEGRTHHLHMVEAGSDFWNRVILFRNLLRTHPDTAAEYAVLKRDLARRHGRDRDAYTEGKTAFIEGIMQHAGARGASQRV